ncbi:MAG: dihydroneopterin aldolase family protein [Methanobrevibacter sp.]|jgi:hypothetical protein|nr:dihydroneopterin aldolase family protein [Candidatus Methanovirga meridionalis]
MNLEEKYFSNISFRERAIFEGGISMAALFHQYIGTPVNEKTVKNLEIAISDSIQLQPAIEMADVSIDLNRIKQANTEFNYVSLSGDMLDVKIYSKINDSLAIIRMEFIEELNYPLMYVEEIIEE